MEDYRINRRSERLEQLKIARKVRTDRANYFPGADRTKKNRRIRQGAMLWYKMTHSCADCGYSDIRALEFDHVRDEKCFILKTAKSKPLQKILDEIKKCDVICANCHRIRTQEKINGSGNGRTAFDIFGL